MEPKKLKEWLEEIKENWKDSFPFKIPAEKLKHLVVICDGNRRAAQERGLNPYWGHRAGVEVIQGIARVCRDWGIRHLTFWVWSTENWKREKPQVEYIMKLATRFLRDRKLRQELKENQARFVHLGRKDRLPRPVSQALSLLEEETKEFSRYWLNLAMDYGGLDEVVRGIREVIRQVKKGVFSEEELAKDPTVFFQFLDTRGQPLPDLVIRTGVREGEIPHTSGLMPLQTAYAVWDFIPQVFPEITPALLRDSLKRFLAYERRFGR